MRDRTLRLTMLGLATIGLGDASYLTVEHYTGGTVACAFNGGCETVQHSSYASLAGVPVSLIGLIGYVLIIGVVLAEGRLLRGEDARFAAVALTVVGFGFSLYLTYREVFTIKAICQWCVGSAVIMTALGGLAVLRFLRGDVAEALPTAPATTQAEAEQPATRGAQIAGAPH